MNWGTVRESIKGILDKPDAHDSIIEEAMVEAMRFNRKYNFWFNEGFLKIYTSEDVYAYELPTDFVGLKGKLFYVPANNSSPEGRRELECLTSQLVETHQTDSYDAWDATIASGPPRGYALFANTLILSPRPDSDDNLIEGRYIRDDGIPRIYYDYSSGTATLEKIDPRGVAITDNYTGAWLNEGQDLTKMRAVYILASRIYSDQGKTAMAIQQWAEILNSLQAENSLRRGGSMKVRPHL